MKSVKFKNPWLVQLATGDRRRVNVKVEDCVITVVGQPIQENLNILSLGSYDIHIGMNWVEKH